MMNLKLKNTRPTEGKTRSVAEQSLQRVKSQSPGFVQMIDNNALWDQCKSRTRQLEGQFDTVAVVGIGGSHLGLLALSQALVPLAKQARLVFFDNVDATVFEEKLRAIPSLLRTHFVLISKSGGTLETLACAEFISQEMRAQGLELSPQCTVVTELRSNPLYDWAKSRSVAVLEVPVNVGGRFSVLSPVGMLPACLLGVDIDAIRSGAREALEADELVLDLSAQALTSFSCEEWITLFWCYSDRLQAFGFWFQQLWAESLAKKVNRAGLPAPRVSSPYVARGANDQHSLLQQVAEGYRDKFIWFFRESAAESGGLMLKSTEFAGTEPLKGRGIGSVLAAEAQATAETLSEAGVQSLTLHLPPLNAHGLGGLFMLCQMVVSVLGESLDINTYDQPGVEAGKRRARKILAN